MRPRRFPLSTDQLELLLAFEKAQGLPELAETMGRDVSVISRGLQRLGELDGVLEKSGRRWTLTARARGIIQATHSFLDQLEGTLAAPPALDSPARRAREGALVVINAQQGLLGEERGPLPEDLLKRLEGLLARWRREKRPVLHVRHVSEKPGSPFARGSAGAEFLPRLAPLAGEIVIDKTRSSAWSGTALEATLEERGLARLVLVGFTANECIDATARDASERGFETVVVGDATATFDLIGPDGRRIRAERVHELTLANLHALYAPVVKTAELL